MAKGCFVGAFLLLISIQLFMSCGETHNHISNRKQGLFKVSIDSLDKLTDTSRSGIRIGNYSVKYFSDGLKTEITAPDFSKQIAAINNKEFRKSLLKHLKPDSQAIQISGHIYYEVDTAYFLNFFDSVFKSIPNLDNGFYSVRDSVLVSYETHKLNNLYPASGEGAVIYRLVTDSSVQYLCFEINLVYGSWSKAGDKIPTQITGSNFSYSFDSDTYYFRQAYECTVTYLIFYDNENMQTDLKHHPNFPEKPFNLFSKRFISTCQFSNSPPLVIKATAYR